MCNAPADGEVGELIGAQMTAANVTVPSVTGATAGVDCGKNCSVKVAQGTSVVLNAAAAAGFHFVNWTGDCVGTALTCSVTVNKDTKAQANFAK